MILTQKNSSQKSIKRDKEKQHLMLTAILHNEDIIIKNTYASNTTAITFKGRNYKGCKKTQKKQL